MIEVKLAEAALRDVGLMKLLEDSPKHTNKYLNNIPVQKSDFITTQKNFKLDVIYERKLLNRVIENKGKSFWVRAKNWFKYKIEDAFDIDL